MPELSLTRTAKPLIKPSVLKAGARVALVAPASRPAKPSDLARACEVITAMGFVPVVGRNVMATHGYMAGTDEQRLEDFRQAVEDPDIRAIWSVSGGFGTIRLLADLPYQKLVEDPKIILGADDVNLLLMAIHSRTGLVTMHAPNLDRFDNRDIYERTFRSLTEVEAAPLEVPKLNSTGKTFVFSSANLPQPYSPAASAAISAGRVLPCNLTALGSIMGTPYEPDFMDTLLLLEDRSERNDILDRWLSNLYIAGALQKTAAVAFGHFEKCDSRGAFNMLSFEEMAVDRLLALQKAFCFELPFGQSATSMVVPFGLAGQLDCRAGQLTFDEEALTR